MSCVHEHRMWKAMESLKPLVERLNHGYIFNIMDENNEIKTLMNKMYLCFSKCLDYQDELTVKLEK